MPSLTTWTRLEPHPSTHDLNKSLTAAIHDPLWLLGRQWQLGEFQGEDNGSPIWVSLAAEHFRLNRYLARAPSSESVHKAIDYDHRDMPLETQVESERIDARNDYRLRVESGTHFLKLLGDAADRYRGQLLKAFALQALSEAQEAVSTENTKRFVTLVAGRMIDGLRVNDALKAGMTLVHADVADLDIVQQATEYWRARYQSWFMDVITPVSWVNDRLEYAFAVSAPLTIRDQSGGDWMPETVLSATEYPGGHLDWYSFSVDADKRHALDSKLPLASPPVVHVGLPAPVRYSGMPVARFWEFEDGDVNFGALNASPEDLSRLLMMEFALVYGNDFFVIPVELPVGTLCRINSLEVTDTFGETFSIRPASRTEPGESAWRMYTLASDNEPNDVKIDTDFLFLPPTLGVQFEGQKLEEVQFTRDEMANLVWAIEHEVPDAIHKTIKRDEVYAMRRGAQLESPPASEDSPIHYRIAATIPDYWYPMQAVQVDSNRRETALHLKIYNPQHPTLGRLLDVSSASFRLREEEIPRAGVRVIRSYQYTRWIDGSHQLWIGRRKRAGQGEGSGGLKFDFLAPKDSE